MKNRLKRELRHFNKLGQNAREVLLSNILFGAGAILTDIFISAFLFINSNQNINVLIFYNIISFVGIYLTFVLNGLLLRFIKINYLYLIGLILRGLIPILIILVSNYTSTEYSIFLGLFSGIGAGFYWANRNYLELDSTNDSQRDYFYAINIAIDTITGMILPVSAGFFITFMRGSNLFSGNIPYFIIMSIGFVLFILSGLTLINNKFHKPPIKKLFIFRATRKWNLIRLSAFWDNFVFGIYVILPTILILKFVGDESSLGIVETVGAILSTIVIYIVGRKIKPKQRLVALFFTLIISIMAVIVFQIFWGLIGVLAFIFLNKIIGPIRGNAIVTMWYEGLEDATKISKENYRYIVDLEFFINIGRITVLLTFFLLLQNLSEEISIRIIVLIFLIANFVTVGTFYLFRKEMQNS